jgi:glycosyltransferase involved in cell wall biosynthesis
VNILLLIDNLGSGGAQRQMVTLAKLLKECGNRVEFLIYDKWSFFKELVEKENIPINSCISRNYVTRIIGIRKFIRRRQFNAVVSFMDTPNFLNCISAIGCRTWKVITSERSSRSSIFSTLKGRTFNWFQRYSDTIVCNSDNAREMWLKFCPQYTDKLVTIYNPVLLPEIKSIYVPKQDGRLHLVVAGSYHYQKNMIGLINALCLLNTKERQEIQIDWYGRQEVTRGNTLAYDEAIALKKENNLDCVIHFNKETKDIAEIMYEADAVGLFSQLEGQPNVICEAMMMGKPVLMSRVSDYSVLVDDSNGFLCDWDNPESIKDILISLMDLSIEELKTMGANSKIKAENLFSPSLAVDKWIHILNLV